MLTANLLTPEEKKSLRRDELKKITVFFAVCITSFFCIGSVLLLPSYLPLFRKLEGLNRSLAVEEEASRKLHIRETSEKIKALRRTLTSLQSFLSTTSHPSALLNTLFSFAGDIRILSLTITKEGSVSLRGNAPTRQYLLDFEKKLRNSGIFEEFSLPLSQIIRETDISFSVDAKLKPEKRL